MQLLCNHGNLMKFPSMPVRLRQVQRGEILLSSWLWSLAQRWRRRLLRLGILLMVVLGIQRCKLGWSLCHWRSQMMFQRTIQGYWQPLSAYLQAQEAHKPEVVATTPRSPVMGGMWRSCPMPIIQLQVIPIILRTSLSMIARPAPLSAYPPILPPAPRSPVMGGMWRSSPMPRIQLQAIRMVRLTSLSMTARPAPLSAYPQAQEVHKPVMVVKDPRSPVMGGMWRSSPGPRIQLQAIQMVFLEETSLSMTARPAPLSAYPKPQEVYKPILKAWNPRSPVMGGMWRSVPMPRIQLQAIRILLRTSLSMTARPAPLSVYPQPQEVHKHKPILVATPPRSPVMGGMWRSIPMPIIQLQAIRMVSLTSSSIKRPPISVSVPVQLPKMKETVGMLHSLLPLLVRAIHPLLAVLVSQ